MTELIITNGDNTVDLMRKAGFDADILPWRDVLHEGPVPETESLERLSGRRAAFLSEAFGLSPEKLAKDFERRDRALRRFPDYDEITLWFEHDLYDQLQLLQLLDFFHREAGSAAVHLVQADDHLGRQTPEAISSFAERRAGVFKTEGSGRRNLRGVPESDAGRASPATRSRSHPLPYMKAALQRLFEDLPGSRDGLSRTQRQILKAIDHEGGPPKRLFGAVQAMEEAVFMGDLSCWRCLEDITFNTSPLVDGLPGRLSMTGTDEDRRRYLDAPLSLTDMGRAVLAGDADHAEINTIDRWFGGTHVTAGDLWRWDRDTGALVAPA